MKVVVVDAGQLPAGVEFPPLETAKYAWEQYPALQGDDIAERCWRADIVVALSTAIDSINLKKMYRLKLLIAAGCACQGLDEIAAQAQGVELLAFPDAECNDSLMAQELCNSIARAIDHYIRNFQH
jgi:phosphoglycerate dehydrogenase-like enzyme